MKLNDIITFLDEKIPQELAFDSDNVGLMGDYDLNSEIDSIKILMDLLPDDDNFEKGTLVITHHPPLFEPETPTYTIHSNWDIIKGGANDALAYNLFLEPVDYFDIFTKIGRICITDYTFKKLENIISNNFKKAYIVNRPDDDYQLTRVAVISGFGLKNPEYIKLAKKLNIDILISGDLVHETAILAKNLGITVIDIGHHESEVPGLCSLAELILLNELDINIEVITKSPIEKLK